MIFKEIMANPGNLFSFCSLSMAALFAYSASVQLNDADWYFWFPLYTLACVVNLMNVRPSSDTRRTVHMCKVALGLGLLLFCKVVMEDLPREIAGFWSLDMSERIVREKTGSGLVMASMALHLRISKDMNQTERNSNSPEWVGFGMVSLVGISYALAFFFFVGTMKF